MKILAHKHKKKIFFIVTNKIREERKPKNEMVCSAIKKASDNQGKKAHFKLHYIPGGVAKADIQINR